MNRSQAGIIRHPAGGIFGRLADDATGGIHPVTEPTTIKVRRPGPLEHMAEQFTAALEPTFNDLLWQLIRAHEERS